MPKLALTFLLFSLAALAADVSGRWKGDAVIDGHANPVHITLVQQGNTLKGTGGPSPIDQALLINPAIEGKKIVFDVAMPGNQPLHFELQADDWTMKGTVKIRHAGQVMTGEVLLRKRTN